MKTKLAKNSSLKDICNETLLPKYKVKQPRQDWERALRAMAERRDDELLDKNLLAQTNWDKHYWKW